MRDDISLLRSIRLTKDKAESADENDNHPAYIRWHGHIVTQLAIIADTVPTNPIDWPYRVSTQTTHTLDRPTIHFRPFVDQENVYSTMAQKS